MKQRTRWARVLPVLALPALALIIPVPAAQAQADDGAEDGAMEERTRRFEVGAFAGAHIFGDTNELGVADMDDAPSLASALDVGLRLTAGITPLLGVEGEVDFHPTNVRDSDPEVSVLALGWRLQGRVQLSDTGVRPFFVLGVGGLTSFSDDEDVLENDTDFVVHGGGGLLIPIAAGFAARIDTRVLLPPSSEGDGLTTDFEFLLGVTRSFGPELGEPPPPPPPEDTDGDGIKDDVDQCVNEAEDMDGFEDEDGCPDADNDGDGIADAQDQCAGEAEDLDGFQDEDGCPDGDNDGDGIADAQDQCANEAEDLDSFQDEDGCPDTDNDGDGIPDAQDGCTSEPETKNGYQDADGCPDEVPEEVKQFTGKIEGIRFANNSDRILLISRRVLDQAVAIFTQYPELRVEISGHSDNRGRREYNVTLSQKRAESVKKYFVDKGIDEGRLRAVGFGPDKPLVDNKTAAGRAQNRRVEFRLLGEDE